MAFTNPLAGHPDAKLLRKEAGGYLKDLREAAGLTQLEVSKALELDHYTLISQIERGVTRVPPEKLAVLASVLGCNRKAFGRRLLRCYDPYMWQLLFGLTP